LTGLARTCGIRRPGTGLGPESGLDLVPYSSLSSGGLRVRPRGLTCQNCLHHQPRQGQHRTVGSTPHGRVNIAWCRVNIARCRVNIAWCRVYWSYGRVVRVYWSYGRVVRVYSRLLLVDGSTAGYCSLTGLYGS